MSMKTNKVAALIDPLTVEGELYEKLEEGIVRCVACAHKCMIKPDQRGFCKVRYNKDGKLFVPYGYVSSLQSDPTEKKPFFHVFPGSDTLTFGMLGCDMRCSYCQNWDISQTLRDEKAGRPVKKISSDEMIGLAMRYGSRCVASSYNEPLITTEWSMDIFEKAKAHDLVTLYVSNGNASREVLQYIQPLTNGFKVDLKTMNADHYRDLGAKRDDVLKAIRMAYEMGFWVEIVTLLVPGFNDSDGEIREIASFIKSIDRSIPWHITAFYPQYKMQEPHDTEASALIHTAEIGYSEGLHFVYAGNRPGQVGKYENTYCPSCQKLLVERFSYVLLDYQITGDGACSNCGAHIPGIWESDPGKVNLGTKNDLLSRRPPIAK